MKLLRCSLLTLLFALLLSLSACHGSRGLDAFVMPDSLDETKQYEITFWAKNDTNKAQTDVYNKAIADFEAIYPNIKINMRLYTDYGRIYNDVITNIATGTTPHICITYPDHIATYMTGTNVVVPLETLMDDTQYGLGGTEVKFDAPTEAEIVPQFLGEGQIGGVQYALPFMRSTEACYVNKTYVEALGYTLPETLTWDFIWEVSRAAAAQDEDGTYLLNGQKVMIPFIYKSTDNMMIQMLAQENAGYSTADGEILLFNDRVKEHLYTIAENVSVGAFSTFKISGYPANFLNAGQCVFAIDSTAGATWMGTDAPLSDIAEENLVRFETVVMEIPQFDPAHPKMISQGPSMCLFNKKDPGEVLASWLFMQFLLSDEIQIGYAKTEGYVPVTTKAQTNPDYLDYMARSGEDTGEHYYVKSDASKLLLENTGNTFVTPVFSGSASLRDAAGHLIESATKSVRRKQTVDDAYIDTLFADTASLYRLDSRGSTATGKTEFGFLPATAVVLLSVLGAVWGLIFVYLIGNRIKKRKKGKKIDKFAKSY